MTELLKRRFRELKVTGQRGGVSAAEKATKDRELIDFLRSVMDSGEADGFEDKGFLYWNLSDSYALLKEPVALYENHLKFYELVRTQDSKYLFWTVSDATQRLTLESGGYGEVWWALYNEACRRDLGQKEHFAEFSAHRAALHTIKAAPYSKSDIETARRNFERFLERLASSPEHAFYKTVYLSLSARLGLTGRPELLPLVDDMLPGLSCPKEPRSFLLGEWRGFTTPPDRRRQSETGLNAIINALIDIGESGQAKALYKKARLLGLPQNGYIEKRLEKGDSRA